MADRVFRRVLRPKRTMQYQEFTEGMLIGDPDTDCAVLVIMKDSRPYIEYRRPMTVAMSEFGVDYVTSSMGGVEGTAALERLKETLTRASEHIGALGATAAPNGGARAPETPVQPPPMPEPIAIAPPQAIIPDAPPAAEPATEAAAPDAAAAVA